MTEIAGLGGITVPGVAAPEDVYATAIIVG